MTKVTSIECQIAGVTENTLDNLADKTKVKAVDISNFVLKAKLASDVTTLENIIDPVDKKIPDISELATKTSLTSYLQTATSNSRVTEVENKIKATNIIAKSANTKVNTIRSDLTGYAKKADVGTDVTAKKIDYVTNASLTSQLNNLKSQHIATEVTSIDNKTKRNANDILAHENKLQQKEDTINENEIGISIFRGFFFYLQQNHLVYECKVDSFNFDNKKILKWKSTGILNYSDYYSMKVIEDTKKEMPILKNDQRMYIYLQGSHFQQNNVLTSNNDHVINNNVINIHIVYKLDPIASIRDTTFTIQNALFGAMQITKNADTSKYHYKGYGICFDESEQFTHVQKKGNFNDTALARNVISFGADMSFSKHANNKANNIYVMGKDHVQKINDTTIYAEKMYYRNFTDPGKKFVLSLHYNGNNSYLFVNGRQELKFKAKTDQLVKEKLCLGNLSDQWTTSESEKNWVIWKNL